MPDNKVTSEDDISLSSLTMFIAAFLRAIFKLLALSGFVIKKSWALLLTGVLAGGLLGFLYHKSGSGNYKVTTVVSYSEFNKRVFGELLADLQTLVMTDSKSTLAADLKIPYDQADNISKIDGQSFLNESLLKDTSNAPLFKIVVSLKKPANVDSLQEALVNYLNDLPYVKQLKAAKTKTYEDRLAFLNAQLGKLDTLKNEYVHSLAAFKSPTTFYNNAFDPAAIYRQSYVLDSIKDATTLLLVSDSHLVSTVSGFKSTQKPEVISQSMSIIAFVLLGFLIAFIFALFAEINKRLNGA
jgi:hypothetical protein